MDRLILLNYYYYLSLYKKRCRCAEGTFNDSSNLPYYALPCTNCT